MARVELERTQQEFNEARRFPLDVARDQHALEANEIQFTHENATRILAQSFVRDGPVYSGRVALVPDPTTASGFAWTSANAAGQTLSAGTLASVEINSRSQPPITLAIPLLEDLTGLERAGCRAVRGRSGE